LSTTPPSLWSAGPDPRLLASRHRASGAMRFPPFAPSSPLADSHETQPLPAQGRVYSFTVIHPNPKSGQPPFALGYVDLAGPVRIFGRVEGEVRIGAACEAVPHAQYGYVFRCEGEQA